jgi:hypothetical protein
MVQQSFAASVQVAEGEAAALGGVGATAGYHRHSTVKEIGITNCGNCGRNDVAVITYRFDRHNPSFNMQLQLAATCAIVLKAIAGAGLALKQWKIVQSNRGIDRPDRLSGEWLIEAT